RCHAPLAGRRLARAGPLHTPPRPGRQTPRGHPAWHGASTPPDAAVNRLDCKKPPTIRPLMGSTPPRDNLDNLLRRKGGRRTRAWVSGQGCHDHGGERLVTAPIDFNRLQLGGEGEPRLAARRSAPARG